MDILYGVDDDMMSGAPVVAGVDGSDNALEAVGIAALHAEGTGRPLLLIRVVEWPYIDALVTPDLSGSMESRARAEAERDLDTAMIAVQKVADDLETRSHVLVANAASALVRASESATLLVLGATGHGAFADLLAGSVAVEVTTHAKCPVLVVRGEGRPQGPVIVGADGSPGSADAVAFAFAEATRRDVGVMAVRAWRHPLSTGPGDEFLPAVVKERQADERAQLESTLDEWRDRCPSVPVTTRVVRGGAAEALVDASDEGQLVIVGSRGHGGFAGLLLGSVGQALLHRAHCPVVVVHPSAPGGTDGLGGKS